MSLTQNLTEIREDLDKYDISRSTLLSNCINEKLKNTLLRYNNELELSTEYLVRKKASVVLKEITKIQREKDKEDLEEIIAQEGATNE